MAGIVGQSQVNQGWSTTAMAVAAAAGAVAIGVVAYLVIMGAGDEPPIRVKNGSVELELARGEWKEAEPCTKGDRKRCWAPSGGESTGVFHVVVSSATPCVIPAGWTIDKVTVIPSVGQGVTLKPGKGLIRQATRVRPYSVLTRDQTKRKLIHNQANAYVTAIEFDGENAQGNPDEMRCTFDGKEDLKAACIWSAEPTDPACVG